MPTMLSKLFAKEVDKLGYSFSGTVECQTVTTYARKGRPKKGEQPIKTVSYRVDCKIGDLNPDLFERLRQLESTFVLIYSIRDQQNPQMFTPVLMCGAGIISGLLGIGSGIFKVMAMDMFMKLPMKVSTATSNFMIGVTAAASADIYFTRGDIHPAIAAPVALGVLIGATLGTRIMIHLRNTTLRKIFIPILFYVSLQMLWEGLHW